MVFSSCSSSYDDFNFRGACQERWQDVKSFFSNLCNSYSEHTGMVVSVSPITEEIPGVFQGKCYHYIKLADKSRFRLMFATIDFSSLEDKLMPGKMIKIIYCQPDYQVLNIFPMEKRCTRTSPLQDVIEDLEDDGINIREITVKACYVDDELHSLEMIRSTDKTNNQLIK